jgi:hypothetical protein
MPEPANGRTTKGARNHQLELAKNNNLTVRIRHSIMKVRNGLEMQESALPLVQDSDHQQHRRVLRVSVTSGAWSLCVRSPVSPRWG